MTIKSINWTYTDLLDTLRYMEKNDQSPELETSGQPTRQECECPDPCNCDHENE